jgi:methyl-accepting chemotaxis protein
MSLLLRRLGLKWLLYIAFPAALGLILLGLGLVVTRSVESALMEGLEARGQALLHNLQARSLLPLMRRKPELATPVIDDCFEDPRVSFVILYTTDGEPFAERVREHAINSRARTQLTEYMRHAEPPGVVVQGSFSLDGTRFFRAPVMTVDVVEGADTRSAEEEHLISAGMEATPTAAGQGALRGFVYLGLSEASMQAQVLAVAKQVAAVLVVGILLFTLMVFLISRMFVLRPLRSMTEAALRVSEYDLTSSVTKVTDDEFGRLADALNRIVHNLNQTLARMRGVTQGVTSVIERIGNSSIVVAGGAQTTLEAAAETSTQMGEMLRRLHGIAGNVDVLDRSAEESTESIVQMAAASDEVVQSIRELADSVEETSTSIERMTFSVKDVAENVEQLSDSAAETSTSMNEMDVSIGQVEGNANETARLSEQVQSEAEIGVGALQKTLRGIDRIKESSQAAARSLHSLSTKILAIGDIVRVIDEVAEQTNLLALNAAIIAAQAGEQGKGFAVVADEIKDLAERTGVSTKEIAELVRGIQEETRSSVVAMERGVQNVEDGVRLGGEAASALRKIYDSASASTQMVKAIARATEEQSRGSKRVAGSITRIADTVLQIARATAEQARGSEQIMRSAERMGLITHRVESSIETQARGSRQVTLSIEKIGEMVKQLNRAQKSQALSAEQVLQAVQNIRRVAEDQRRSTLELEEAIELLQRQAEILRGEVLRFRV